MVDLLVVRKGGIATAVNDAIAAQKNAANGIAPLDADSKVPAANSRVASVAGRKDDVLLSVVDVVGAVAKAGDTMIGPLETRGDITRRETSTAQYSAPSFIMIHEAVAAANRKFFFTLENPVAGGGANAVFFLRHEKSGSPYTFRDLLRYDTADEVLRLSGSEVHANGSKVLVATDKGATNGVAPLSGGVVPEQYIPAVALGKPFEVASQAAMLALVVEVGDVAIRSDINKSFMLRASPASTLANWSELRTPTDTVLSVNERTGAVNLSDLFAAIGDARLRTIRDEGVALPNRPILDLLGNGIIAEDDAANGRTKVTISGAAAGAASEAAAGITEQATQAEIQAGTAGNLFPTAERLAVELNRRGPMDAEIDLTRSTNQSFAHNILANVIWNSEILDPRNWHDNTTNPERITPDAAGRYSGTAYIIWASSTVASQRRVRILRWVGGVANVIADSYVGLGTAAQFTSAGPQVVAFNTRLALGEYLTVEALQNTGGPLDLSSASIFSMARVL